MCLLPQETPHGQENNVSQLSGHPNLMLRFPSPDRPIFWKSQKKKIPESLIKKQVLFLQAHDLVLLTPIVLNYHRYFVFVALLDV